MGYDLCCLIVWICLQFCIRASETFNKAAAEQLSLLQRLHRAGVKEAHQVHHRAGAGWGKGDIADHQELLGQTEGVRPGQGDDHQFLRIRGEVL